MKTDASSTSAKSPAGLAVFCAASTATSPQTTQSTSGRLDWVDRLRTVLTILVVNLHATIVYSHVGSWYFMHPTEPSIPVKIGFLVWEAHLQAFFMGLFFFIAGYFAHFSLQRRGVAGFLRERLMRLGVPLMVYVLMIHPFILFVLNPWRVARPGIHVSYGQYLSSGRVFDGTGPLWFAEALLIFSFVFALWRLCFPTREVEPIRSVTWKTILGIGLLMGAITFVVRLFQPIGVTVQNLQFCFFTQYIVVFILGIRVARRWDLNALAEQPWAVRMGWTALALGPIALLGAVYLALPIVDGKPAAFFGGWNSSALAYALWEQCAGISIAVGLMAWLKKHTNSSTPFSRWLADRSFAVYVLHAPVLVGLTMLLRNYYGNPYLLALVLSLLSVCASYVVADLIRRLPGAKRVL